ncbi:MAG: hypothetical protein V4592_15680 [Bacteroidota bacterium]
MKYLLIPLFCLLTITYANAQTTPRMVRFRTIGRDSINLALNEDYQMIEDSCATIIRYAHYNTGKRIFFGKFKDVSKQNPSLVLSEGTYTADGIKDGEFVSRYVNGNLQSKGVFKDGKYDGKWELNYENGKPRMTFEASNGLIKFVDVWNEKGSKTIDNGKGSYTVNLGSITWAGKLDNGRPDGTWKAYRTDDASQSTMIKESFKKGEFQKGANSISEYVDASRIVFFNTDMLPYVNAEKMMVSPTACGEAKQKHIVNAQYREGASAFSQEIGRLVSPYLGTVNIAPYNDQLILDGVVSKSGSIANLRYTSIFSEEIARGLVNQLRRLPLLQPAMADGKPVEQKITITFTFRLGSYSFSWRLLPITQK